MEVTHMMNKRKRELTLQRVSRIGSLPSVEGVPVNVKFKGKPQGVLTIEEALALYMYDTCKHQEVFIPKIRRTRQHNNHRQHRPHNDNSQQTVYDRMDANRCAGFLLYSYDRRGAHSVLGENITPGSCGGGNMGGEFKMKA
jgi:hypothetical protein